MRRLKEDKIELVIRDSTGILCVSVQRPLYCWI